MIRLLCLWLLLILVPAHAGEAETELRLLPASVQKKLAQRPRPARGSYDLAFDFYDGPDPERALLIGSESLFAVPLRNGRFAITLDIPPSLRRYREIWLNIQAAPGGTDAYANLSRRNLPIKTAEQQRISGKLRVSGTILDRKGSLVLGPYETVWLHPPKRRTQVAQSTKPAEKKPPPPKPPATVFERIQRDLGIQPTEIRVNASLNRHWPGVVFPVHGSGQLLGLMKADNGQAVESPPDSLLFLLEIADTDAVLLAALQGTDNGFPLKLRFSARGKPAWMEIQFTHARLLEYHRLDPGLYSLRIHPGDMNLRYRPAATNPLAVLDTPEPAG